MENITSFKNKTKSLIDDLKSVCANYGLGNDGNEFKIITQIFLYKYLNDKFIYEIKKLDKKLSNSENLEKAIKELNKKEYDILLMQLNENVARLKPEQFISSLFERQNEPNFSKIFDNNLLDISNENRGIFSVLTSSGEKIVLFENISKYVSDKRDEFCVAIINKLINFSFENIFEESFDFYSSIFEYLIKDYNINSGSTYAEYFTPHAVSKVMASCLVDEKVNNVTCYDPSAGSGTLLMNIAQAIGVNKCTIYSQDISQKSSQLLRLNLILNNLVHSMLNIVQGNTILEPFHKQSKGGLKKFDYIVSNPPFKLDFSDYRDALDTKENHDRFFAGIPKIPPKDKKKMAIYLLFFQHIIKSISEKGKAAIVVPTGFLTSKSIGKKIREHLINFKMLRGVISMPKDIFADTGTNVSIIFFDNNNNTDAILINASNLGKIVKLGKNQKTLLSKDDEELIINTFKTSKKIDNFSVKVSYEQVIKKRYSFSAGQYFDVKVDHTDISSQEFDTKINNFKKDLENFFKDSKEYEKKIPEEFNKIKYEN